MLVTWYFLLNFIYFIFKILNFITLSLLRFDSTTLNFITAKFEKYYVNFYDKILDTSDYKILKSGGYIPFNQLYNEVPFFKKNIKKSVVKRLIVLKLFSLSYQDYNFSLNFLIENLNLKKQIRCYKTNLNYFSNRCSLHKLNYYPKLAFNKLVLTYTFSKFTLIKLNPNNIGIYKKFDSYKIRYSPSNFIKYINNSKLNKYSILFLRKNKVFNKGRYSRNRQYYRTGVYWCLYVNIIAVIGIYFWFYKFSMNFGYLWWILYSFLFSFITPKAINYRLYNVYLLYISYSTGFIWFCTILNNYIVSLYTYISKKIIHKNSKINLFSLVKVYKLILGVFKIVNYSAILFDLLYISNYNRVTLYNYKNWIIAKTYTPKPMIR